MMIAYNELSQAVGYDIIGYDDLFIVENLDLQDKVVDDKKVGDEVKIEDVNLRLDDCNIVIGAVEMYIIMIF